MGWYEYSLIAFLVVGYIACGVVNFGLICGQYGQIPYDVIREVGHENDIDSLAWANKESPICIRRAYAIAIVLSLLGPISLFFTLIETRYGKSGWRIR